MFGKISAFISKYWVYILSCIGIIAIAQTPIMLHVLRAPEGFYFPYLDKIAFSDYYYPALIKYGMGVEWLVQIPYVITPHTPSIIQIFFIFLGKFALLFRIDAFLTLAIWRVIGGVVLLVCSIYFISEFVPKAKQRFVFVLFLCAQPLSPFINIWKDHYEVWIWHFGEAARRISAMPPHYTIGKGLMILSISTWFHYLQSHDKRILSLCLFVTLIGAIIYPPSFFILFASLFGGTILYILFHEANGKHVLRQLIINKFSASAFLFLITIIIPMILLKLELAKGYPWNMWNKVELGWNKSSIQFELEYIRQLGVLIVFLPIVILDFIRHPLRKLSDYWILFWAGSAFVFFPFANTMNLGKFRFTEGMQILPLSVVAYWGGQILTKWLKKKCGDVMSNLLGKSAFILFILYFFLFTFLVAKDSYFSLSGLFRNVYMYPDEYAILKYLDTHVKDYPVIISDMYSANFLPAFAHVRTALGFPDFFESYNAFLAVNNETNKFLKQQFTKPEAIQFLKSQKAGYVYYPIYAYGPAHLYPDILDEFSGNSLIEIYKVKKDIL